MGGTTGINATETTATAKVYAVNGMAYVQFDESGNYGVEVFDAAGALVARKVQAVGAGQSVQVRLPQKGMYVLKVTKGGKTLRVVKLMNKF